MGSTGAIQFDAWNTYLLTHRRIKYKVIVSIRQMYDVALDRWSIAFAPLEVTAGGTHEEIASPQGAQVHANAALHVNKQRTLAFPL